MEYKEMKIEHQDFDPESKVHLMRMYGMWRDYRWEQYDLTRRIPRGLGLDVRMGTSLVVVQDNPIAFITIDYGMKALELMYVEPAWRRQGLTTALLRTMKNLCPGEFTAKPPITPAMQPILDALAIPVRQETDEEIASALEVERKVEAALRARCPHRPPNPARGCRKCHRAFIEMQTEAEINFYLSMSKGMRNGHA